MSNTRAELRRQARAEAKAARSQPVVRQRVEHHSGHCDTCGEWSDELTHGDEDGMTFTLMGPAGEEVVSFEQFKARLLAGPNASLIPTPSEAHAAYRSSMRVPPHGAQPM